MRHHDMKSENKDIEEKGCIPERELWLYESPKAKKMVSKGLEQARKGEIRKNVIDLKAFEE